MVDASLVPSYYEYAGDQEAVVGYDDGATSSFHLQESVAAQPRTAIPTDVFNASAVDYRFTALWNSYLAVEQFGVSLFGSNLVNALARSTGTFIFGLFYYSLLSSTSPGPLRERLESLDFFFGEQNWLNTIVTNLQFWFIFFVGNLTLRLFLRGPQGIVEGIQMSEFEAIVRNVILPRNAWNRVYRFFGEFLGATFGYMILGIVGAYIFGVEDTGKKRRRRGANKSGPVADAENLPDMDEYSIRKEFERTMARIGALES